MMHRAIRKRKEERDRDRDREKALLVHCKKSSPRGCFATHLLVLRPQCGRIIFPTTISNIWSVNVDDAIPGTCQFCSLSTSTLANPAPPQSWRLIISWLLLLLLLLFDAYCAGSLVGSVIVHVPWDAAAETSTSFFASHILAAMFLLQNSEHLLQSIPLLRRSTPITAEYGLRPRLISWQWTVSA